MNKETPMTSLTAAIKSASREDWIWLAYLAAVAGVFGVLEARALHHKHDTLSAFVWRANRAWPPFGALLGFGVGQLFNHFEWPDQGLNETDKREGR
jgi:H+/Cl- antiporter ClcA